MNLRSRLLLLCLLLFVFWITSCSSRKSLLGVTPSPSLPILSTPSTPNLQPSNTPLSPTIVATRTGLPTAFSQECIAWDKASAFIGRTRCVRGNVFRTYSNGKAFFIDFDSTRRAFFGTSLTTRWEFANGACVELDGTILNWQERPYIVLDKDDVRFCGSAVLPFSVALSQATTAPTQAPIATNHSATNVDAQVTRVIDGDTIDVNIGGKIYRVRYIGVDTPETVDPSQPAQCFGREASALNKQLVEGKNVRLEKDISETDKYGRLLRYVYVGDLFVNAELVRLGFAQVVTYPPDVKYVDLYLQLQREAREANRGLWGACNSFASPTPPIIVAPPNGNCDPSYPDVCIPPYPPDLDCGQIPYRRFRVIGADRHRFDGDRDGVGCES